MPTDEDFAALATRVSNAEAKLETVAVQSAQVNEIKQDIALIQNAIGNITAALRNDGIEDATSLAALAIKISEVKDRVDLISGKIGPNL